MAFGSRNRFRKPGNNCNYGIGICKLKAIFVEIDFSRTLVGNVGLDEDNSTLYVEFTNATKLNELWNGTEVMKIESGDEYVDFSELLSDFEIEGLTLTQGEYEFYTNSEGNTEIAIPVTTW